MEISPQQVRTASFKVAKRGYESGEVSAFLQGVADALEAAQNQAAAMEARARAAVARLQELNARPTDVTIPADEAEAISKTMVLAQRTADTTLAEAKAEAERLLTAAREEASTTIDSTREMSAALVEEARQEARRASAEERERAEGEVQSLLARRDFLEADVDHLEQFLVDERERLRAAAEALVELSERVPGGLGQVRPPLLSAADAGGSVDDEAADDLEDTGEIEAPAPAPPLDEAGDVEGSAADLGETTEAVAPGDLAPDAEEAAAADGTDEAGEPTQLFEPVPPRRDRDAGDQTPPSLGEPPR